MNKAHKTPKTDNQGATHDVTTTKTTHTGTRRGRIERRAAAEAAWFYGTWGGRVPADASTKQGAAARDIERWLKELPSFHRGALSLRYTPREWPARLVDEFGDKTSLIVRLECAQHPAVGKSNAELEAASVERLTAAIEAAARGRHRRKALGRGTVAGDEEVELTDLVARADKHIRSAVRALAKLRGDAPCVVPHWTDKEVDACR